MSEPLRRKTKRMNPPMLLSFSTRLRLYIQTSERYCTSWKTSNSAIPTRIFATRLLQYHQKAMLVASKATFTGLGRFPTIHSRPKWRRKDRNRDGRKKEQLLAVMNDRCGDKR